MSLVATTFLGLGLLGSSVLAAEPAAEVATELATEAASTASAAMGRIADPSQFGWSIEPVDGSVVDAREVFLAGEVTGATRLIVEGQEVELVDSRFRAGPFHVLPGTRAWILVAFDAAGRKTERLHRLEIDSLAPRILVSRPRDGAVVRSSPLTLRGTVADQFVDRLEVNGQAVPVERKHFETELTLQPGENEIVLVAYDTVGHRSEERRRVVFDPDAPELEVLVELAAGPELGTGSAVGATHGTAGNAAHEAAGPMPLLDDARFAVPVLPRIHVADAGETRLEVVVDGARWSEGGWVGAGEHELWSTLR